MFKIENKTKQDMLRPKKKSGSSSKALENKNIEALNYEWNKPFYWTR